VSHPNMSYCMWQNTLLALQQCANDMEKRDANEDDGEPSEPLSRDEQAAKTAVLALAAEMLEQAA
jgi:hypothetical protein